MKKLAVFFVIVLISGSCSFAQDMGFRTTDIGAEFQKYKHGTIYNLHVAFNAKLNHSVQLRFGYNKVSSYEANKHKEFGEGWSSGLGYRYYFKPFPHKFFFGVRADGWVMKINVDTYPAAGPYYYTKNTFMFIPAAEAGYTLVVNNNFFITPSVSAGYKTGFKDSHSIQYYQNEFLLCAALSAGIRF